MKKSIYALYRGDEFIDLGTAEELARKRGVSKNTIIFISSPTYKKRHKEYDRVILAYKIEN